MTYRIRSIAQKSGVNAVTLRAWERRYGFPHPDRTGSGYRSYSEEDLAQIIAVKHLIEGGAAASEAIAIVRKKEAETTVTPEQLVEQFMTAALDVDEIECERIAQRAEAMLSPRDFCRRFALPALRESALRLDVACEHLATAIIRGALRRGLERLPPGKKPIVLACPSGEQHEVGLLAIAVERRLAGWRTLFLGADTPVDAIAKTARRTQATIVALTMIRPRTETDFRRVLGDIVTACGKVPVVVGGLCARRFLRAVFDCGATYAESTEELLATRTK